MAGKIVADTLEHSTAGSIATNYVVNGSAKAWANFGGDTTLVVNQSFNVSSSTDQATGDFDFNFSNSLNAIGSGFNACGRYSNGTEFASQSGARVFTTHVSVKCGSNTDTLVDWDEGNTGVFGDLA